MKKLLSSLCAGMLAAAMGATSVVPSVAMPQVPAPVVTPATDAPLIQVQSREEFRRLRRENRVDRRIDRRIDRLERRQDRREARRDFERRNNGNYYYKGYRGYRYARPGYRYHNGYYFPLAAFAAGAIISGAIASQPRVVVRESGGSHVNWCYNRYRSYRASDNTYQPLSGPRRQCYSPYN